MNNKHFVAKITFLINKFGIFFCLILLFIVSLLNKFPNGYIYSWSDFPQIINFKGTLEWFIYSFIDIGEGSWNTLYVPFYYSILGFFQNFIGVQYTQVVYCFIFLAGSFCSFYLAAIFFGLERQRHKNIILCFSLLYAINPYTVLRFALPHIFFLPYIFIPVLFAATYAYFIESKVFNRNLLWCAIFMLISTVCWVNPPYFLALVILISAFIILIIIFCRNCSFFILIKKCLLYCFVFASSFAIYLLTWPPILLNIIKDIGQGKYQADMHAWISSQALTVMEVFSFRNMEFGLVNINKVFLLFFFAFTFAFFILPIISFFNFHNNRFKNTYLVFYFMILITIFLLNKGRGFPWEETVYSMFISNVILSSLRSFDKILIFLPFMLIILYCLYSSGIKRKFIPLILLIFTLFFSYPFIQGDLYKRHYAVENGKDYLTSEYSSLVKIPQEYFDITSETNQIKSDLKIFSVPWSLKNPDLKGWLIAPKWKNVGYNPVIQYFNHPFVQMNTPTVFRGWNYGEEWNEQGDSESLWLMYLSGMLNTKYLIFQKDVLEMFVNKATSKINFYKEKEFINLLDSNQYFDFFEISNKFFLPHFYIPDGLYIIKKPSRIPLVFEKALKCEKPVILESDCENLAGLILDDNRIIIEYKKINPAKYKVKFHGISESLPFVFSESFDSSWKVYPVNYTGTESCNIEGYRIFDQNDTYQATKEEIQLYYKNGWISELGNGAEKKRKISFWTSFNSEKSYEEKYYVDFLSKEIKGVIQNDNISGGHFYDTWFLKPIDEKYHQIANGYANYWQVDIEYLNKNFPGFLKENANGTYDLEVIVEFWPQKILGIAKVYTILFAVVICFLLVRTYVFKKN